MARQLSALVLSLQADTQGFRKELLAARGVAARETATIAQSVEQIGKAFAKRRGDIKTVSDEILRFGRDATGALGNVSPVVDTLLGAFKSGGPLVAGIAAVGTGLGLAIAKIKEMREEAQKLEALETVTGITKRQVDDLRKALSDAGVSLSRIDAANLARIAQEARISHEQIVANATAIKALATLDGISFNNAAQKFFEELKTEAVSAQEAIDAIREAISGLRGSDPVLARGEKEIQKLQEDQRKFREEEYETARLRAVEAEREWRFTKNATEEQHKAYLAAQKAFRNAQEKLDTYDQEIQRIENLLVKYQLEKDASEQAKKAEQDRAKASEKAKKAAEEAAAREMQSIETAINAAKARKDYEAVINLELEKRLKVLDSLSRKNLISEEDLETERTLAIQDAEKQREQLRANRLQREWELEIAHKQRLASLTATRVDDLELELERELRAIDQKLKDEVFSVQQAEREKARIREYFAALREQAEQEEAKATKEKRDQELANAYNVGFSAAAAMTQGLAEGMKTGEAKHVLRGLFGVLSIVGGFVGGPAVGAALSGFANLFAGFFSEGGFVNGPRSSKRDNLIARVEAGEFVVNREATSRHRALLEAINSGSLSFAGAFASGGYVGSSPAAPAVGNTTNVYVAALDPKQTADVLAHRLEPAQVRRGMTRQDEALMATIRTRINRRTGRSR